MKAAKLVLLGALALGLGGCSLLFGAREQPVDFWQPVLSPDGRFLAYVARPGGARTYGLYVLDLQSQEERLLVRMDQDVVYPTWSPDGARLAFIGMQEKDNWDLFVVEVATGRVQRLTTDPALDVNPFWAADGTIVFNSNRGGSWGAWAIRPDGTELRKLSFDRPRP
ncbi:MAG: DPP IV N-terminal domain-containing protein [Candidatus Bipolaricaulota bacterium]|nr:DPP IV N-terminal domain-containing protein [Candidatus Bipolaricaulota bacterium]MDW8152246.1 DPP IV N-terminal domain-containing protein [Candidatus Bipolaricaulota bacterium]